MKHIKFEFMRKCRTRVALTLLVIMLMEFLNVPTAMAAELKEDNVIPENVSAESVAMPLADANTYYFIKPSEFYFTGSNTGNTFNVPKACQGRLMVAFVAMDDAREENVTVEVWNTSGYREQRFSVPTNKGKVIAFNLTRGDTFLRYYGRSGVRYHASVRLYTWDY